MGEWSLQTGEFVCPGGGLVMICEGVPGLKGEPEADGFASAWSSRSRTG